MRRVLYEVVPCMRGWKVTREGLAVITRRKKAEAVNNARAKAAAEWRDDGQPCELLIKGIDGEIKQKESYGNDPPGIKG